MRWCCGGGGGAAPAGSAPVPTAAHAHAHPLDPAQLSPVLRTTASDPARNRVHAVRRVHIETEAEDQIDEQTNPLLPHSPATRNSSKYDRFGPMLLQLLKTALYVHNGNQLECAFLERLRQAGWLLISTKAADAFHDLQKHKPAVVLLDHKLNDLIDLHALLKNSPDGEEVLFVMLVDRTPSEKRLRQLGKKCISHFFLYGSTDISLCELVGRFSSRLRALPALFAVVEEAEQPVKICDEQNVVQYVNRAYEVITGQHRNDVLGTDASDMRLKALNGGPPHNVTHQTVPEGISSSIPPLAPASSATTPCSASGTIASCGGSAGAGTRSDHHHNHHHHETENLAPSGGSFGSATTHVIHSAHAATLGTTQRRRSSEWHCITVPGSSASQQGAQYVYVKRGSTDGICRDLSLKSLSFRSNSAMVEAPISEALSVLSSVLPKCDEETQTHLKEAIRMLSAQELYAPSITRFTHNDRIASGYYDGLIRLHHPARQRKRSVVDAFRENQRRVSGSESRRRISSDVVNALEAENAWQFDVIELERVTDHHPLAHLGAKIFDRWSVADTLRCSSDTIQRWLTLMEANYQTTNPYHNGTHAADVLQATSYFLNSENVGQHVQDTHAIAALIAAAVHDLDHPGRGNAFLMNTRQRLALLYNDHSVLENHHVALAFHLTLSQPGANIFARMPRCEFAALRQAIIEMVLATDMTKHFEYLTRFQQMMLNSQEHEDGREANSLTVCRLLIKCADIGNPAREWKLCHEWAMRIVEEYFEQTSEETEKGLPVTMKGFDRETCNIPMTQCTFVDMFARETFTVWTEFAELPILLVLLESNYERWKQKADGWDIQINKTLRSLKP